MTNEELILMKLENIESQIEPFIKITKSITELKDDLIPLQNIAFQAMINELQEIEAGFQLEDFLALIKQTLRNTNELIFAIKQLSSIIEFVRDLEPLLRSAVPQMIHYLDQLEQQGVFRVIKSTLDVRAKVAEAYDADDIDIIGDVFVDLLGIAKKLSDPKAKAFIEKAASLPANIDLENSKKAGFFNLLSAGFSDELKEGLGVMMELTKAMGKLKGNGNGVSENKEEDLLEERP